MWTDPPRGGSARYPWPIALALALGVAACQSGPPPRWNVLLVVVDTLRADHLGCYGHPFDTSPHLDALATEAIVFDRAHAPAPRTAASHASLFTSTYPASHGVWNELRLADGSTAYPALAPEALTLAELLRAAGYQTAAVADGGWIQRGRGLDQGFDHFDSRYCGVRDRVAAARDWLRRRDRARPFFLFLHTYQVHTPYLPERGYEEPFVGDYRGGLHDALAEARAFLADNDPHDLENPLVELQERFFRPHLFDDDDWPTPKIDDADAAYLAGLYDAEIALVDEAFAKLLGDLRETGLLDSTLVIVTSDHGEEFAEHGQLFHKQVYQSTLRIPLLLRLPGGAAAGRRPEPVDLLDLMPTILAALGLEVPSAAQGRVIELDAGADPPPRRPIFGETLLPWAPHRQLSVSRDGLKAVLHPAAGRATEVFDLERDPHERHDIAATAAGRAFAARAGDEIDTWRRRCADHRERFDLYPVLPEDRLDEHALAELRALGYLR